MPRAAALVAIALVAGCYQPSPPSGSYLCGPGGACPTGMQCACGQCVTHGGDAACSFVISFPSASPTPTVNEHHPLPIAIQALDAAGAPATGFRGTVQLSSSWGEVSPTTLAFSGGRSPDGTTVSLNRETLPPAVARLTVSIGAASTTSSGIEVVAPPFQPDPPVPTPLGWTPRAAEANLVKVGSQLRMYFVGGSSTQQGIGLATSSDGVTWTATSQPVLMGSRLSSPAVYSTAMGTQMAYTGESGTGIGRALSPDGLSPFVPQPGDLVQGSQCVYCAGTAAFPQVLPDLSAPVPDGGAPPWLMFFSAVAADGSVSIARASSVDGVSFTPEPAPILQGTLGGEAILLSPRVLFDGGVLKMWYSFASIGNLQALSCSATRLCPNALTCNMAPGASIGTCGGPADDAFAVLCESGVEVQIGYATSSDGFFWTRSESNPVITLAGFQPTDHALLVSGVIAADGTDPASGVTVYYSTFHHLVGLDGKTRCLPSGIYRATARP